MKVAVFDSTRCILGEGPLWHPERAQLFWFDIDGKRLMTRTEDGPRDWFFDMHVSAAGWIDRDHLLIASEVGLHNFDLRDGSKELIVEMEADDPVTRSNDGRADPWGGFWIGTMGKGLEPKAGAIYRFHENKLTQLYDNITVSNAICFAPDRSCAYYADTQTCQIMRQTLDGDGWPDGPSSVFIDLSADRLKPDGAVVDAEGCLWNAQWGASRVARYDTDGAFMSAIALPATHTTCPAFGGTDMTTLYVTSSGDGLEGEDEGRTFRIETGIKGQTEHRVIL